MGNRRTSTKATTQGVVADKDKLPEPANSSTQAAEVQPGATGEINGTEEQTTGPISEGVQEPGSGLPPVVTAESEETSEVKKTQQVEEHPNPARNQSDIAEESNARKKEVDQVVDKLKELITDKVKEIAGAFTPSAEARSLMDQLQVDELFENSKGEYFTVHNFAVLSENGKAALVKTHKR